MVRLFIHELIDTRTICDNPSNQSCPTDLKNQTDRKTRLESRSRLDVGLRPNTKSLPIRVYFLVIYKGTTYVHITSGSHLYDKENHNRFN